MGILCATPRRSMDRISPSEGDDCGSIPHEGICVISHQVDKYSLGGSTSKSLGLLALLLGEFPNDDVAGLEEVFA